MNNKSNKALWIVIAILCALVVALAYPYIQRSYYGNTSDKVGTAVIRDTAWMYTERFFDQPVATDSIILGYIKVRNEGECQAPLRPSVGDSVSPEERTMSEATPDTARGDYCLVPITQKVYRDSTYTAWVSGYMPRLDSIRLSIRSPCITETVMKTQKRKVFGLGIQGGVGMTPKGLQPYIGVGLSFNIK